MSLIMLHRLRLIDALCMLQLHAINFVSSVFLEDLYLVLLQLAINDDVGGWLVTSFRIG